MSGNESVASKLVCEKERKVKKRKRKISEKCVKISGGQFQQTLVLIPVQDSGESALDRVRVID